MLVNFISNIYNTIVKILNNGWFKASTLVFVVYLIYYWKYCKNRLRLYYARRGALKVGEGNANTPKANISSRKQITAQQVIQKSQMLNEPANNNISNVCYWPPLFFHNTHFQIVISAYANGPPDITYERQLLTLSDHGTITMDWFIDKPALRADAPIIILFHGLVGSSNSSYIKHIVYSIKRMHSYSKNDSEISDNDKQNGVDSKQWRVVVCNSRGCGGSKLSTAKGFNAEHTLDTKEAIECVRNKFPKAKAMFAVGYSLGSNILINYVGRASDNVLLTAASSVSNPFDLEKSDKFLNSNRALTNLYNRKLADSLKDFYLQHSHVYDEYNAEVAAFNETTSNPEIPANSAKLTSTTTSSSRPKQVKHSQSVTIMKRSYNNSKAKKCKHSKYNRAPHATINKAKVLKSKTIRDFDNSFIVPQFSFKDANEYYKESSCINRLKDIKIPVLLLNALDDPLFPESSIPYDEVNKNENLLLALTENGSHVGWLTGSLSVSALLRRRCWADELLIDFFQTVLRLHLGDVY